MSADLTVDQLLFSPHFINAFLGVVSASVGFYFVQFSAFRLQERLAPASSRRLQAKKYAFQ